MKIKFDAYEIAQSPLHAVGKNYSRPGVVHPQTIPTSDIMEKASGECTLTTIDISAVIGSLARHLRLQLLQGHAVHIDGIGTFSLSLKFDNPTISREDITARNVQVAGVNFTPDHDLLASLQHEATFERATAYRSTPVTEAEAVLALRKYFTDHKAITKRTFQMLLGLKYGRATKLLLALVSHNKLASSRVGQTNFYRPGDAL